MEKIFKPLKKKDLKKLAPLYCDICETDMVDHRLNFSFIGINFKFESADRGKHHKEYNRIMKTFGKLEVNICFI